MTYQASFTTEGTYIADSLIGGNSALLVSKQVTIASTACPNKPPQMAARIHSLSWVKIFLSQPLGAAHWCTRVATLLTWVWSLARATPLIASLISYG